MLTMQCSASSYDLLQLHGCKPKVYDFPNSQYGTVQCMFLGHTSSTNSDGHSKLLTMPCNLLKNLS